MLYKSSDVISIQDNHVIIKFPKKNPIEINTNIFSPSEITTIIEKTYCNGCLQISDKGFQGKYCWCPLSCKLTNHM